MSISCVLPALTLAFSVPLTTVHSPCASRSAPTTRGAVSMLDEAAPYTETEASTRTEVNWIISPSGYKFIEEKVGKGVPPARGDVVQVHYTVSLLSSGTTLGTSRDGAPITMAVGTHDVPIWDEALSGMREGGKRRMLLPPEALPEFQADKVPGENRELRFDFELLRTVHPWSPLAKLASVLPPHRRPRMPRSVTSVMPKGIKSVQVYFIVWMLSFVPYFLPYDQQPQYHDGKPVEQIRAEREHRANTFANGRFLGGDIDSLDTLFP